ncbi:FecR domain-containing protein [Sphingomonas sp. AP4-R1]|uniref:FecR family protein n=1 Tax=Sphingomonas sp. AP4-R1 TaxID=2735134 RepID=UPI0020A2FDD8|nr:FecR domain-containing protein [Sphingomonas sp. AP4-R1]
MADRERAADIDDAAIDWAARAERGLSDTERTELDRWLESDPRRLGAYVRAQAAWIHAERAVALGAMPEGTGAGEAEQPEPITPNRRHRPDRRMILGGGAAIAASVAAVAFVGRGRVRTLESGVGEIRKLALADGTTIMLDTDTKVDVAGAGDGRRLTLQRGKIFLDVARRGARALGIDAGGLAMEMAEGAVGIQAMAGLPLVALVAKGQLTVSQSDGLFRAPRRLDLREYQELSLADGAPLGAGAIRAIAASERDRFLAWRDGMISFGGETLATAVRAFDRYGTVRIVVDPELAAQKITGLFRADDPRGFAAVAAASFGGIVSGQGEIVRILAKKSPSA